MRHRVKGKHLSRTSSHRRALRRNMAASLIQHGAVRTTEPKAKELRGFVEKLITAARRGTLAARRQVVALLQDRAMTDDKGEFLDKSVVQKLFDEVAPRYADRPGGYTRIIRLADRRIGDAGRQVVLQLVEEKASAEAEATPVASRRRRRAAKRHEAAEAASKERPAEAEPAPEPAPPSQGTAPAQEGTQEPAGQ